MYQAGIKNITLYENKNIRFRFYDPLNLRAITDITTEGQIIQIENNQQPEFDLKIKRSDSGYLTFEYKIEYFLLGFFTDNISAIEQITTSIYGWCFLVEFYDGTKKFFNTPVFSDESEIEPQDEMSFEMELETKVPTLEQFYEFTPDISTVPIYRADTTLLTADTTIYTADYAL